MRLIGSFTWVALKDSKVRQPEMAALGAAADICLHFTSKGVSVAKYGPGITHCIYAHTFREIGRSENIAENM